MQNNTIWRQIDDTEYDVSNFGQVRSHKRRNPDGSPKILNQTKLNGWHLGVSIEGKSRYVHRLVAEAFHGPAPDEKSQALHWDDNPTNNRADNIYWGTAQQNATDRNFNRNPDRVARWTPELEAKFDEVVVGLSQATDQNSDEILNLLAGRLFELIEPKAA